MRTVLLAAPLLCACSIFPSRPDDTRFYLLSAVAPRAASVESAPPVGLGPVELPAYLDRVELVSREGQSELKFSDRDHWGEPLDDSFRRALREDLVALLGGGRVLLYPFEGPRPDRVLVIDVSRFEPVDGREAELAAHWSLRAGGGGPVLAERDSAVRERITCDEPRCAVAALSRALGTFAAELATAVRGAGGPAPTARALAPH